MGMSRPPSGGGVSERKVQFGPSKEGMGVWSPNPQLSSRGKNTELANEARAIAQVLIENEQPMTQAQIIEQVGARYWGPRVFSRALHYALRQQMIRQVGTGMYAPPRMAPGEKKEESQPTEG
jgi:hypothetical protein